MVIDCVPSKETLVKDLSGDLNRLFCEGEQRLELCPSVHHVCCRPLSFTPLFTRVVAAVIRSDVFHDPLTLLHVRVSFGF